MLERVCGRRNVLVGFPFALLREIKVYSSRFWMFWAHVVAETAKKLIIYIIHWFCLARLNTMKCFSFLWKDFEDLYHQVNLAQISFLYSDRCTHSWKSWRASAFHGFRECLQKEPTILSRSLPLMSTRNHSKLEWRVWYYRTLGVSPSVSFLYRKFCSKSGYKIETFFQRCKLPLPG